ncbi:MAG: ammonia-forming cytochrome c nitrite reductase subunit c552 [Fimbriimonadaceae bacterium]|nr:ammonia-forming cytochrome c nitrite reductase subunit c552 [Fimbriimonadaceae bacterium]QOJ12627.1 MAG: ammonia-forming cytochrome c nitrite reductase subunit c552 [Chthonomonadaceae bacterium]
MNDKPTSHDAPTRRSSAWGWLVFGGSALGVVALGLLAASIGERRMESIPARLQFMKDIPDWEADNSVWGASFPREYQSWEATKQMNSKTKYGGSGFRDYLESTPRLVIMWAGYAFAKEYNQARGHYYAVEDVTMTKRVNEKTPATCWTCKSPDVPRLMDKVGIGEFYALNFHDFKDEVKNPIGCADCHDNKTMQLRISRPALKEAFERQGKDITKVSHQEMRSLVCAQCHVEYYGSSLFGVGSGS